MIRVVSLVLGIVSATATFAQAKKPSHCIALAQNPGIEYLHLAGWQDPLDPYSVRLNYIDHATFLIQSPGGVSAATDYTGFLGLIDLVPDVVTMNRAHESHWTAFPDPEIPHVLRGWGEDGRVADHALNVGDMLVRNVPTDIRNALWDGVIEGGNSVFVFEVEGLCIGHLGHLHHALTDQQYAALGRLDVVMAPVDGGMTLTTAELAEVLARLKSSLVLPMHWFSRSNLEAFLEAMSEDFVIRRTLDSSVEVSLRSLPDRPTILVLSPAFLRGAQ